MNTTHFDTSRMSTLAETALIDIDQKLEKVDQGMDLSEVIDQIYAILARLGHEFNKISKKSYAYLEFEIKAHVTELSSSYKSKWTLGFTFISASFSIGVPGLQFAGFFRDVKIEQISIMSQGLSSASQLIEKRQEATRTELNHTAESLKDLKRDKQEFKRTQSEESKQTARNKKDAQQAENQAKMSILRA